MAVPLAMSRSGVNGRPRRSGEIGRLRAVGAFLFGGLVLALISSIIYATDQPTFWAPAPFPIFFLAAGGGPAYAIAPLAFWLFGIRVAIGRERASVFSLTLQVLIGIVNLAWLIDGWSLGARYQGPWHTVIVTGESLLLYAVALGCGLVCRRRPSYVWNYANHWLVCLWLGWAAFPTLGEAL